MACRASSCVLTMGTTTPHAPASNAHLNHSTLLLGMRTKGAQVPASAMAPTISAMIAAVWALCSISTTSQSKPSRAITRAEATLGRLSHAPNAGSPRDYLSRVPVYQDGMDHPHQTCVRRRHPPLPA